MFDPLPAANAMKVTNVRVLGLKGYPAPNGLNLSSLGHINSFVGPNGSGKTTILEVLHSLFGFMSAHTFNQKVKASQDDWLGWTQAHLRYEPDPNEDGSPGQFADFQGRSTSFIEFELSREDGEETKISRIVSANGTLSLRNIQIPYLKNEETLKTLSAQRTRLGQTMQNSQAQRSTAQHQLNQNRGQQHQYQEELSRLDAYIRKLQGEIDLNQQEINEAEVELLDFIDEQTGDSINVTRAGLVGYLKKLGFPPVRYIQVKMSPTESIAKLLNDAIDSKKGLDTDEYYRLMKELSNFLQANADVYEKKSDRFLTVDRVDHRKLSNGTQVCLYYFSLVYETHDRTIILWDEPENGLHATRRYKLLDLFLKDRRQFFIGTHATELAPVLDQRCEVYQLTGEFKRPNILLDARHVTGRRGGFEIAESLGIYPASTLFTANVVIWVEGPSELRFWRHWLHHEGAQFNLVEGFDYTFMLFGGANIANCSISDAPELIPGFDLLSLCRYPVVIIDSDFQSKPQSATNELKPGARRALEALEQLKKERPGSGLFFFTEGRELENYLPTRAIKYAVEKLGNYTKAELETLDLDSFRLEKYDRYFEALERYFISKQVTSGTPPEKVHAKHFSTWGERSKVDFMKTALECEGLMSSELQHDAKDQISKLVEWIKERRVDRK